MAAGYPKRGDAHKKIRPFALTLTSDMPGIESNPLAVLTFIAAPAILTNASSVLALGTSNRFARNVERSRAIIASLRSEKDPQHEMVEMLRGQLGRTERRATLLIRSLSSFYF